ncbi:hypothetical protein LINPERPRIM_LOCUS31573 [Linum perenne]
MAAPVVTTPLRRRERFRRRRFGYSGGDDPTPTPRTISKEEVGCSGGDDPTPRQLVLYLR